jgi:hypothetical protein
MKSRKNHSFSNKSHLCLSMLSTDLFRAVNVTPVHQCSVCLLICSAQYMWLPCLSMLSIDLLCAVNMTPVPQCADYWYVLRSKCDSRASVCCLPICSAQYMWLPCFSMLSIDQFCAVHVTPVHQYAVYWSVLRSTCDSRASVCRLLICSAQYMWLPCFSMSSTDLFCAVHVTPVLQYAVYLSVLRGICDSRAAVCSLLICSTQYMWLPCLTILSINLLYALHVAHVHWSAVCITRGSCPLICCMQYTWLKPTDLLYAVHVTTVFQYAIHCAHYGWLD